MKMPSPSGLDAVLMHLTIAASELDRVAGDAMQRFAEGAYRCEKLSKLADIGNERYVIEDVIRCVRATRDEAAGAKP